MLIGSYNSLLVLFSLLVAMLAAYTALDMAGRINTADGSAARCWLAGGAFAMGMGIWSMHFIGMLAFSLPIPIGFDPAITSLSLLIAIVSSAFALWLVCQKELRRTRLLIGALLMGTGVAGMHYTGMAAMRMQPGIQYTPSIFAVSVLIAVVASGVALWVAFNLRQNSPRVRPLRAGAAVAMGFAIVGMHYTGMAAAEFPLGSVCAAARNGMHQGWVAITIIIVTLIVLSVALTISVLEDMRLASRAAILAASLAQANEELTYLALHDSLTKLPNRVLLEDRLGQAIQQANGERKGFALMFMDLDGFKIINDAYGHQTGDQLLAIVAERVGAIVRREDTVARLGGDEFVLLVHVSDPIEVATLAERLQAVIREPFHVHGHALCVSTSIGIAMYPEDAMHMHDLLVHADTAMYHAKSLGRGRHCFFESSMSANARQHMQLAQDLHDALPRHELVLHYQPKLAAPRGPVIGVEALVRWMHPVHGLLMPDQFISLAEKGGQIIPIGEWVLDEACRQLRAWHDAGYRDWTMAVNLSPMQFCHSDLIAMVRATLQRHALAPASLTLEITESVAMRDFEASLRILQQLRDMGVRISIDDFGTGYSSLLYLKRLPANELKIDRGFVRDLLHDPEDEAIVSAIVALGQKLHLTIVAEGVETTAQQEFLTGVGCDSLQGFLLGRPMPATGFVQLGQTV
ncbi:putative bifunctional diguanylate cyclase/phosphodiesterase [Paraburkholderia diazotrophica]|uniref:putative bifunctional diguanylate cyclase/phosphodiesterase n=1 Tax=Paraburkholderia diazotrophica TaxID=667676 RepID=UPI003180E57A